MIIFKPVIWLIKVVTITFIIYLVFLLIKTHPHPILYVKHETVIVLEHTRMGIGRLIAWINPKGA